MFERQVAYYLNKYLGRYVYNVDASALKISIFRGNVELHNLQLKPEALNELNLPITVKSGLLGSLKLKVPWANLGGEPVICELDSIYVLAVPNTGGGGTHTGKDTEEAAEQADKRQKVDEAEHDFIKAWKQSLDIQAEKQTQSKSKGDAEGGQQGRLQYYIETILGNLQICVSNVHVRYEDAESVAGEVFACGLTLEEISAYTVDSNNKRTFVSRQALDHLRKTATLRRLAFYFDVGSTRWTPPTKDWKSMARSHWDGMFLPSVREEGSANSHKHQYILAPVHGQLVYDRISGKQRKKLPESHPTEQADLSLASVDVGLQEGQYKCVQALLEAISMHKQRMPHMHLRPHSRPRGHRGVCRWWQYAMRATIGEGASSRGLSWEKIQAACRVRREYIPLYVECLTAGKVGGNERIRQLDTDLSIAVIVHFRKTAHMKVEKQKRLEAMKKREQQIAAGEQRGWFSLMGWSPGGGGGQPRESRSPQKADSDAGLNEDEMAQLEELAEEQKLVLEEAQKAATPFTVLKLLKVTISSCSVALSDTSGMEVIKASMNSSSVQSKFYPKTIEANVQIGEIKAWSFDDELLTSNMKSVGKRDVLDLHLIHSPQDGRADDVINLTVNPTYVTYDGMLMERMLAFVERNQNVNLGAIGAQAGAMADSVAAEMKTKVTAAWEARQTPRMLLNLTMEAPRIALPVRDLTGTTAVGKASDGTEEVLVLDLGFFQLQSDNVTAGKLSEAEARVYECLVLKGSRVQASSNHIQVPFSWERWEEARHSSRPTEGKNKQSRSFPLIDPIELYCEFQFAKFMHPTFPSLRSKVILPRLQFHISPARLSRMMSLARDFSRGGAASGQREPTWMKEVDFSGEVRLLSWKGMTWSNAVWEERWGALWYGWLYVMEGRESFTVIRSASIFNQHTLKVPPEAVDGMENVVAICSEPRLSQRVLESPNTVILQFKTSPLAASWLWRIHIAKQRMAALIPTSMLHGGEELLGGKGPSGADGATNAGGAGQLSTRDAGGESSAPPATPSGGLSIFTTNAEANPENAIRDRASKVAMVTTVDVGVFQLWVSGRTVDTWWPAQDFHEMKPQRHSYPSESPLIVLDGQGMRLDMQMSATHITSSASLASLMIHDQLVGLQRNDCRHLAVSNKLQLLEDLPGGAAPAASSSEVSPQRGNVSFHSAHGSRSLHAHNLSDLQKSFKSGAGSDDEFFDAQEAMSMASQSSETPANPNTLTQRDPTSVPGLLEGFDLGDDAPEAQESSKLARLTFKMWKPESPLYDDVDVEVSMKLATLFFYCNRPTVAALMALGPDMNAAMSPPTPEDDADADAEGVGMGGRASAAVDSTSLVKGAENRVTFRLLAEMETLEATFNYEGTDAFPLLEASMQHFSFNLDMKPSTLSLESKLGNLVARDRSFGHEYLFSTICDLRPEGDIDSLIELQYSTYKGNSMPDTSGRMPPRTDFAWLKAKLNAVDIVFLNRQLQELLSYIDLLLVLQPSPIAPQRATRDADDSFSQGSGRSTPLGRKTSRTHSRRSSRELFDFVHSRLSFSGEERTDGRSFSGGVRNISRKASSGATGKALMLLMDVDMRAPVITMPLSSFSDDEIEVDLGHLHLANRVVSERCGGQTVLMDIIEIKVDGITTSTTVNRERNTGLVRFQEGASLRTTVRRMLNGPEHIMPGISLDIVIPEVNVDLKDKEFQLIAAIAASNLNESLNIPPGVKQLQQTLTLRSDSQEMAKPSPIFEGEEWMEADEESSWPSIKVTVQLSATQLVLLTTSEGVADGRPLASMLMPGMSVDYKGSLSGMSVLVAIPNIIVTDLRQSTPENSRVVMASSSGQQSKLSETGPQQSSPSMVVLQYITDTQEGSQMLNTRLQRPTFIAEMGFVMSLLGFVSPPKEELQEYISGDLLLKSEITRAKADLWLSPDCRLLADGPFSDDYLLDGCGMRLVLPPGITQSEPLPLILIGSGKTLRIINFDVVNASSLSGCLLLGHGGQMIALPEDGIVMKSEDSFEAAQPTENGKQLNRQISVARTEDAPPGANRPGGSMTINLTAVGVSLNFLDLVRSEAGVVDAMQADATEAFVDAADSEQASYMLTTNLDIAMTYSLLGSGDQQLEADLHDVLVEAYLGGAVKQEGDASIFTLEPPAGHIDSSGGNTLLQPCDVSFKYGTHNKITDIQLNTSDMVVTVGIDMLDVLARLQDRVLGPLSKPPPDRPVAAAMTFAKVWPQTTEQLSGMPPYTNTRDVDLFTAERGFTVWRPQVPFGYLSLGDVITQGSKLPRHHAACIAKESGLTAAPQDYQLVMTEGDLCIWTPVPPAGFVAMGCVCSTNKSPPPMGTITCVRSDVVVQTAPGECLCMRTRLCGPMKRMAGGEPAIEHLRLWTVANSPGSFVLLVQDSDQVAIPSGLCFDLRSPLGSIPHALHAHITEATTHGKLNGPSPNVVRHQLALVEPSESGGDEGSVADVECSALAQDYEVLEWDVALQRELAYAYARRDHDLRRQRTRDHECLEVAEFHKLWMYDNKARRVSFWRPILPPGYVNLGDCMSFSVHPPKLVTVFLDDSQGHMSSEELPKFSKPIKFQKMWDGTSFHRNRPGEKEIVSLWQPVPPALYTAIGWVAWTGRQPPTPETCAIRCIRSTLVELMDDAEEEKVVWPLPGGKHGRRKQKESIAVWNTNHYTWTFWGNLEQGEFPGGGKSISWDISLLNDTLSTSQHASGLEDPHYKITLDLGLMSIMMLDMTREPLVEMNLGGAEALQGRSAFCQNRSGRHCKRPGVSAHMRETAPGLLQAFSEMSLELWSYNKTRWEPVLEPFVVLVHFDHNSRSRIVSTLRPGSHVTIKGTSDEGLHLTVAHAALDSLLRSFQDASKVMEGSTTDLLASAHKSAQYAYVQNRLGVPVQALLDYGQQTASATVSDGGMMRMVLPRANQYKRKRPEPPSAPKGLLVINVQRLELKPDSQSQGGLFASVALAPAHELDQCMTVQTRWGMPVKTGSRSCVDWQEQLILKLPDDEVMALSNLRADSYSAEGTGSEASIILQVAVHDVAARAGRGGRVAAGMVQLTHSWLLSQLNRREATVPLSCRVRLTNGGGSGEAWGDMGVTVALEWSSRGSVAPASTGGPAGQKGSSGSTALASARMRLHDADPWSPLSSINAVRRGAGDSAALAASDDLSAASAVRPVIVTPVTVLSGDARRCFAIEESIEAGVRNLVARSLCQITNHTGVSLKVGLVRSSGEGDSQRRRDASIMHTLQHSKRMTSSIVNGVLQLSVVEVVYENQRHVRMRGFGAEGCLTAKDEREGHRRYEWRDMEDKLCSDWKFPSIRLPPGWEWASDWALECGHQGEASDGFIYGNSWNELTFPPAPGKEKPSFSGVRRRMFTRRRVLTQSAAGDINEGVEVLGSIPPFGRLPLPLNWDEGEVQVVLRPEIVNTEAAESEAEAAAIMQMCEAAHRWSICIAGNSAGIDLSALQDGKAQLMACPPSHPSQGAVQLATPGKSLRKFTAFQGTVFWMSAQAVANPFQTLNVEGGIVDWELVVTPPLVVENLLPVHTDFFVWEKPQGGSSLKLRCEGALTSGGSVQVHSVDMRNEVYISVAPDSCSKEAEPVMLSPGIDARSGRQPPISFDVHHTGHTCKSPLTLFLERRACAKNADTDPRAMASVAQGSKLTVSLYSGLIVLNGTQLPLYVATERGRSRRRDEKGPQPMGAIPIGGQDESLPVEETIGILHGSQSPPEGCKFPPGTVHMMSFPLNSEHEYSVKVALEGSSWATPMSLENEVPTSPWLLRAHIGGTQQIHEVVVSLVPCTGAFGRSQLLKLDSHIVVTNLTGLPLQLRQCTHPKPVVQSGAAKLLQAVSSRKIASPFGGEQMGKSGLRATKTLEEGSKEAVKQVKSRLHSALSARVKSTKGRKLLSMPSSSLARSDSYQDPLVVSSRSVRDWETDNIGVMDLPPNSVAVPMYWSESCWQKSLCVSLVEAGGPQRLSSPIQLTLPGFEEQFISVPTTPRGSLSRASSQTSMASATASGGEKGGCPFAYGSSRAAGTKLRTALAGSPLCRPLGAEKHMQECYSDEESLVMRVSATVKRFNCLHLTFHSVTTAAPAAVDNRSANTVLFRKVDGVEETEWHIAHPWTCVPVVWDTIATAERAVELLELGLADRGIPRRYNFRRDPKLRHAGSGNVEMVEVEDSDPYDGEAWEGSTRGAPHTPASSVRSTLRGMDSGWAMVDPESFAAEQPLLPTSGADGSLMVRLETVGRGFHPMAAGSVVLGAGTVGSRALGLCSRPQHLVMLPNSKPAADNTAFLSTQLNSLPTRLYLLFSLSSIQVSVVDHTPQELILLSVDGLNLEYSMGLGVANTMSYLYLKVKDFQADNMLPYTRYPVFVAQVTAKDDRAQDPVLEVVFNAEQSQDMAHIYYPYIYGTVGKTLVLNMCEALLWNALGMYKNLSLPNNGQSQTPANVQADSTVEIKLLTLGALKTRLSFGTAPDARAAIDTGSVGYLMSLAAFKDLPFSIDGYERTDLQAPRSIIMENMVRNGTNHVFNLAFRILRSSVSLHSASRAIGGVSSQVAKLSMDDEYREIRDQQSQQEARHLGEGLAGGGEAFAKSVLWGFTGIVRRPWQGAQQSGALGFVEGLGTGVVGAVVQPMSGLLDLVSKTAEGAGATMDKATKVITGDDIPRPKTRRRLPRAISGDQCLQPFNKEAAQGQMLLWSAKRAPGMEEIINMRFRMVRVAKYKGDKYEAHMKLPASRHALITNTRVMLLTEISKGASSSRVSSPGSSGGNEVVLEWECEWEDVLSLQLKRSKSAPTSDPPDRLILYRREGSPDGVMQHEWRCESRSAQAEQLLEMVQSARLKYSESFRRIRSPDSRLSQSASPAGSISRGLGSQATLATWSSGAWKLIWRSYAGGPVSIWRPVAREGYSVLGDVLTVGVASPDMKVLTLRSDEEVGRGQAETSPGGNSGGGPDFPVTAQPVSYWLVWRSSGKGSAPAYIANGEGPLSLWLPVAPNDRYRALGCVAMSSLEEPPLSLGRCVRRDLLDAAELEPIPVWKGMASDKTSWRCTMWRIMNSTVHTFFASRGPDSRGFRFYRPSLDVVHTARSDS